MVAAVLGAFGVAGATVVLIAARHQHRIDRATVAGFVRAELPAIEAARTAEGDLEGLNVELIGPRDSDVVHANLARKRNEAERARQLMLAEPTPRILLDTATEYLNAIRNTLRAISILDEAALARALPLRGATLASYRGALRDADAGFARGRARLSKLECRAELPECAPE
jgi:hypothetical protein